MQASQSSKGVSGDAFKGSGIDPKALAFVLQSVATATKTLLGLVPEENQFEAQLSVNVLKAQLTTLCTASPASDSKPGHGGTKSVPGSTPASGPSVSGMLDKQGQYQAAAQHRAAQHPAAPAPAPAPKPVPFTAQASAAGAGAIPNTMPAQTAASAPPPSPISATQDT